MKKSSKMISTVLFFIAIGCLFIAAVLFFKHNMEEQIAHSAIENIKPDKDMAVTIEGQPIKTAAPYAGTGILTYTGANTETDAGSHSHTGTYIYARCKSLCRKLFGQ